jgi:hypothetical protein
LSELLIEELILQLGSLPSNALLVINRMVVEVERICTKSERIQKGGDIHEWQLTLARHDCADYLILKLQDLAAPEIDDILGLTPRQRDYLQQRFKYHVEKFARSSHWQLVHQWLGAELDQKLGLKEPQWEAFVGQLDPMQQQLLSLKRAILERF